MQIKSGDARFCVSTFFHHKFQSTFLTTSSQCASLAATVFWCMHIGVDCSGDAKSCVSTFLQHKFQPTILTTSSQCASLAVTVFWCMHIGMDCSGDARFCVSTFFHHKFQSAFLTLKSQCASLVETQNLASHEQPVASLIHHKIPISNMQIKSGDAKSCISTFLQHKFQSTILTTSSQRASLVVGVFFATRIIVEKKRHSTHRKLTENRVYPDNIYFASVYADFSVYA